MVSWKVALYRTDGLAYCYILAFITGVFQNINASSIEEAEKLKRLKTEAGVVIKQTLRKTLGKQLQ